MNKKNNKLGALPVWNLKDLYPSKKSSELEEDIKKAENKIAKFEELYSGRVKTLDADLLAKAIKEYETIEDILGRLMSYAYLLYSENMSNQSNAVFYQNISEKINEYSASLLFFELEINQISNNDLLKKQEENSKLKKYSPWLRDVRAFRNHQLSKDVEKILLEKSITSKQSWHRLFEETLADLTFPYGTKKLTCAEILNNLSSKNSLKRKKSAKVFGQILGDNIKIFTQITNVLAKDKEIEDRWRRFDLPISSRNLSNFLEDEVVETLIETVQKNHKNLSHRYYKLKAKWFRKKHLYYWDRNAPLPNESSKLIKWPDAVKIVLDAYREFSPTMADIGQEFFDKKWIHAPVVPGKDSGAFSHPTVPSAHPYILMNFQGKTRDVMTLAHELGHGIHQVLSGGQGPLMADTPLTLAETASVFGEQLTFRSLLENETNKKKRQVMIAGKVEDMLNTVVRQIAFCEFERKVHRARRKGELSTEEICNFWTHVQSKSLGPAIKFTDEYKYYWAYIPHFIHTPFYVYSYAFGDCLVNSLYGVYQNSPKNFEDKYIQMLKAGGSLRHKELLAPFGLDATDPKFWQRGLNVISDFIDELE